MQSLETAGAEGKVLSDPCCRERRWVWTCPSLRPLLPFHSVPEFGSGLLSVHVGRVDGAACACLGEERGKCLEVFVEFTYLSTEGEKLYVSVLSLLTFFFNDGFVCRVMAQIDCFVHKPRGGGFPGLHVVIDTVACVLF